MESDNTDGIVSCDRDGQFHETQTHFHLTQAGQFHVTQTGQFHVIPTRQFHM